MTSIGDSASIDLATLVEHEIPEGRQNLENSYSNLERVAAYCEANYMQAADKHAALDETRRYTVQSLASVAYQINTLASNLLQMLDLQTEKIGDMESQVSNISQIIDIHKEKVARREIGVLTTNKVVVRQHKIVSPAQQEKAQRYVRRPIDYSALDDLGHSVRLNNSISNRLIARTGSTVSSGSGGSNASVPVSMHSYAGFAGSNAAESQYGTGRYTSLTKGGISKEYRTPITIAPPTLPTGVQNADYAAYRHAGLVQTSQSNMTQQRRPTPSTGVYASNSYSAVNVDRASVPPPSALSQQQQSDGSGYAPTYASSVAYFMSSNNPAGSRTAPQSRFAQSSNNYAQFGYEGSGDGDQSAVTSNRVAYGSTVNSVMNSGGAGYNSLPYNTSYAPQPGSGDFSMQQQAYRAGASSNALPPPPVDFDFIDDMDHSPPLPPPPQVDYQHQGDLGGGMSQMPQAQQQQQIYGRGMGAVRRETNLPEGVPVTYIEKVIAIYDYQAEKGDELSFQENAVIYVLKKNEDGWYEGVLDGVAGLFPGNYVESCF